MELDSLFAADSLWLGIIGSILFVGAAWLILRRSWGVSSSAPPPVAGTAAPEDDLDPFAIIEAPPVLAAAGGELVPITHPLIRRAAESALRQGGSTARAIVRQGDMLYFSFAHIADPTDRKAAYTLARELAGDEAAQVDLAAAMHLIRRLFKD
jgi:hypothetical protein